MHRSPGSSPSARHFLVLLLRNFVLGTSCDHEPGSTDWERFDRILRHNNVTNICFHTLGDHGIPPPYLDRWKSNFTATLVRYSQLLKAAVELFSILEELGIPAVGLRGISLANWLYPQPAFRPMQDLDILVSAGDKDSLIASLEKFDLHPNRVCRSQLHYRVFDVKVELHLSFLTTKRYREQLESRALVETRRPVDTPGGRIWCLTPENELITLILHGFIHHQFDRLIQLVDVALVALRPDLDWDHIAGVCEQASLSRLVSFGLSYADRLFDLGLFLDRSIETRFVQGCTPELHDAYLAPLLGMDSRLFFLRRLGNQLAVAERPLVKLQQLLRFIDTRTFRRLAFGLK